MYAHTGNGGGGGGGVINVLAPVQRGVSESDMTANVRSGLNGSAAPFARVASPSNPTYDNPSTVVIETVPQDVNGLVVIDARPAARLLPHGPFWLPGGPGAPDPTLGGAAIAEIGQGGPRHTFSGAVLSPTELDVDIDASGYCGLYSTAIRPQTAGNDCYSSADNAALGVTSDTADCLVEPLGRRARRSDRPAAPWTGRSVRGRTDHTKCRRSRGQ